MEAFPFYLTYMADGSVEINSFNEVGIYGWASYVYIAYRFLNENSERSIWRTETSLVKGSYDTAKNEITITCDKFTDKAGLTHQITGLDYVLYTSQTGYYEAAEMIRPGYLIGEGDNRRVDYGVGPYKLTKAPAAAAVPAKRPAFRAPVSSADAVLRSASSLSDCRPTVSPKRKFAPVATICGRGEFSGNVQPYATVWSAWRSARRNSASRRSSGSRVPDRFRGGCATRVR